MVSSAKFHENKKREFEGLELLISRDILMSHPIDLGICNSGRSVYSLLTWINAGIFLKQMHRIPAPKSMPSWEERFNRKIDMKISNYKSCDIHFHGAKEMIEYIEDNRHLLLDRPQSFQHGDYHVGNMIITPKNELGIIDFNRMDYGDPWEEFNRITFCVSTSPIFASGYINGYFDNKIPDLFFKIMALYIANNQLSSISWAIPFGEKEVSTMLKQAENVLKWYDDFKTYIPNWYVKNYL